MSRMLDELNVVKAHQEWMTKYGITYANSSEMEKRFQIFKENLEYIEKFNSAGNKSYTIGLNPYSDLTTKEFRDTYTGFKVSSQVSSSKTRSNPKLFNITDNLPTDLDWRDKGVVTDVKKQGNCGGCWAFAAVAAVEGFWKNKMGTLLTLSEQQLIDCAKDGNGCSGHDFVDGYSTIIKSDGILEESQYPYKEKAETCQNVDMDKTEAYITCFFVLTTNDEQNLLRAVAEQPVAVGFATADDIMKYKGGVYSGPCGPRLDHAITIVGYGTTKEGVKYWLAKNSWGKDWGENGYIRIRRQSDGPEGICGIATHAAIPCIDS